MFVSNSGFVYQYLVMMAFQKQVLEGKHLSAT